MHMDFLRPSSKKGRSRFSKALPVPPPPPPPYDPLQVSSPPQLPPPISNDRIKQLPSIPRVPVRSPQVTSPVMSDKPLPPPQSHNQSLPPLPSLETKELPRMHIARRPVAKQPAPQSTPQQQQQQQQQQQHSPTESIGSLLSAYSRSSGESLIMSPDGSSTQRDSAPMYASEQDGTRQAKILTPNSLSFGDNDAAYTNYGAQKFTSDKSLPPAPAFDYEQGPPPPAKSGQTATVGSPTSFGSGSPQQQQRPIWRRRSVKSDRNIEVSDLKLAVSHGSTAASQPNTAQPSSYSAVPPPTQQQYPPRTSSGLPGRNIRPGQHQISPPAATAAEDGMGQEVSRLREKISRLRGEEGANVGASHSDTALSPTQRLPTPDYEKEDVKTPVVDTVVSPISPASSPKPAADQATTEAKPPVPRKAVTERNIHNAQSLPQMRAEQPVTNSEAPPTIKQFPVSPLSPESQAQFPARTTSNQQQQQQQQRAQWQPTGQEHVPKFAQQGGDMRPASRDQRPRQGSGEYRELREKDMPSADARSSAFPLYTPEPPSPSVVYNALPIKDSMLDCYVRHRVMDRTRNRNYALTCQTCGKADTEDRFKCQWCYVRMCTSCFKTFNSNRRDLRKLLAHLEGNPQSSDSQGPAAAPLQPNEAVATGEQKAQQQPVEEHQHQQHQPQMVAA
ncbi:uncharacterized protein CTRU02_212776 [Colletotrichum truncatum]|uniref:Uncharacterized protein n=1 Tax=Colletotrichum truncatum TaxID=5467 RepID=A0ACC3YIU7_COLTU|nr:uncharacterized protein CTRU02_05145 [Colletotrichum truncatum]KAF6794313.1 hypothetical protein CTRU02_05145 [Colletotrichum truncatum]